MSLARNMLNILHGFRKLIAFATFPDFPVCLSENSSVEMRIRVVHWLNDTDRGRRVYLEKSLSVDMISI